MGPRGAATVPFDDRLAREFTIDDLRARSVREFLREIRSALVDEPNDLEIYRHMRLTARINSHEVPRNVALLFFSDDPERAFRGSRIEAVRFANGGDVLEENVFRGPLHLQVRGCLSFLRQVAALHVHKVPNRAETDNWLDYPFPALEEALVNAVYHRSYEAMPEPTKVYIYTDRIEITSYPGPAPGLNREHFEPDRQLPAVTARNRRIGEIFKELRMAEARGTGVRKIRSAMAANGSPLPRFEFDEGRTYFTVVLPIHPSALPRQLETSTVDVGQNGLILVAVEGESIRPVVEKSLERSGLGHAKILLDYAMPGYVEPESQSWEEVARKVRNAIKQCIDEPGIERLHLFYHGPVAIAPLLGALVASSAKPAFVYHYENGRYGLAYTIDRRFLIGKD